MTTYNEFTKARPGLFFGLSAPQLATVALLILPAVSALGDAQWGAFLAWTMVWMMASLLIVVPVRGRTAGGWLLSSAAFALGAILGVSRFRNRTAMGIPNDEELIDLPGVLAEVEVREGPPQGPDQTRIALIQHHGLRTWAVTARVVHPGIGLTNNHERELLGVALDDLIKVCSRGGLVDELIFQVRTLPDDGAERRHWMNEHQRADAPELSKVVNQGLLDSLGLAPVRTEAFVTLVVSEARLSRVAKESGGGIDGRGRVLYGLMGAVESHLRGSLKMSSVAWMTSPELSAATRTGFAPSERERIVAALNAKARNPEVNANVSWDMAGPAGADSAVRYYSHDAWNSVSSAIKLPITGVLMGALAPILYPVGELAGSRVSFTITYPIMSPDESRQQARRTATKSFLGRSLNDAVKRAPSTEDNDQAAKISLQETKQARGGILIRPYAVATVTAPKTVRITGAAAQLDATIRNAGFEPLRLDLAHDIGFVATALPLGVTLRRGRTK